MYSVVIAMVNFLECVCLVNWTWWISFWCENEAI